MSNMTPLQKSIAEIEAEIKAIREKNFNEEAEGRYHYIMVGLRSAISILTATLEYERDVIKDAYEQGESDARDGYYGYKKGYNSAHDYYTKTYEHDNRL